MATYIVDTHALVWFLTANPRLGNAARDAMDDPDAELVVPAIALAEALWIVEKRSGSIKPTDILDALDSDPRINVYPLTREVVAEAQSLTGIAEMHDRQIAATALAFSNDEKPIVLLTRDKDIAASGLVATIW